jgi:hypothetical protein
MMIRSFGASRIGSSSRNGRADTRYGHTRQLACMTRTQRAPGKLRIAARPKLHDATSDRANGWNYSGQMWRPI